MTVVSSLLRDNEARGGFAISWGFTPPTGGSGIGPGIYSRAGTLLIQDSILDGKSLTTSSQGQGIVLKDPDRPYYDLGEQVTLTASPGRWHVFSQWADGVTSNPRVVTIGPVNTYTAVFSAAVPLEDLNFGGVSRLAPVGMPAVFVDGVFIVESNVSVRGSATVLLSTTFPNGTLLFTLNGSDPSISGRLYDGPFVVRRSATLRAMAYNADFTQAVQSDPVEIVILPTLSTTTAGGGTVAVDPPAGAYFNNGTATVTATPAPGWTFLHWLGDATGTNPAAMVGMSRNRCVEAVFGTALSNTVVGGGSVFRRPQGTLYPHGTTVRLTPWPAAGNYFALWGNAASGTNQPLEFTVTNANPTVTAVFAALPANQHALTVLAEGFGRVSVSPRANRYGTGTNVTLTALPEPGQGFLYWSDDASGTNNPITVTMNSSKFIRAYFTRRPRLEVLTCGGVPDGDAMRLLVRGDFGATYLIEAADTLGPGANWPGIGLVETTYGAAQFNDPFVTNRTQRFYRAEPAP